MSSDLYPVPMTPLELIFMWLRIILVLAFFLIVPYLYVRFAEGRLKSFLEKIWQRVSFDFGRKFHWMWL